MSATPGPWQIDGPEFFRRRDAYSVYSGSEESYWRGIAEIPCQHPTGQNEQGEPIWETDEANARLIAAAPDLLAAAKEARDELAQYTARWCEELAAKLDEAIEKAEQ